MKHVLFDMDGVLMDSEPILLHSLCHILKEFGREVTCDELLPVVGMTSATILDYLWQTYNLDFTKEQFGAAQARQYTNFYLDNSELCLLPGTEEFLQRLQGGGRQVGLASSTSAKSILMALNRFSLVQYFRAIVGGDMVTQVKPHPEPYLRAADWLRVPPADCVVVEDSVYGIRAGKSAGMTVVALTATAIVHDTSRADYAVPSYEALWQLFKQEGWA